jgi:hypothetical protein
MILTQLATEAKRHVPLILLLNACGDQSYNRPQRLFLSCYTAGGDIGG